MSEVAKSARKRTRPENALDFSDLLEAFPAAVYVTDAEGRVTFFNRAAADLAGREPRLGEDKWCITWRLYAASGEPLPLDQCPMAVTLKTGRPVRNVEVIAERPDGVRVPVMPFPTPLFDAAGTLVGGVNMLVDVSDVRQVEAAAARRADEQTALYRFTDRLYRAGSITEIYEAALDAILSALRCSRASILLFDAAGVMRFAASRGLSKAYRDAVTGHTPWKPGEADATPITIEDVAKADLTDDLRATISDEGIGALAFIPLVAKGGVIGKFMVYHDKPHVFSAGEIELAQTIALQLGFALERQRADAYRVEAESSLSRSEERFRAIVETTPECVKLVARDGTLLHMNASGLEMIGADCFEVVEGQSIYDVIAPEHKAMFKAFNERICDGDRGSLEFDIIGLGGERRRMETHAAPFQMTDGATVQLAVTRDVSARHQAEERQRKSDAEFRALADNIHQLAWMTDENGWIYWYNQRWFDYTGTTLEQMQGWGWQSVHHPDHVGRVTAKFKAHLGSGEPWEDTFPLRGKDGAYRWFLSRALPIRDEHGDIVRWFGTNTDITERLEAEQQRTLLINELNHRVKNTLATVQSLAMQTVRSTSSRAEAVALFNSRLGALSRAHDLLTLESWQGAHLRDVIERATAPFRADDRVTLEGPTVRLTPKQALALSIALHELGTNATKYGALSAPPGHVQVTWKVEGPQLLLHWREKDGPPVTPPTRAGFGARLIQQNLAHDLGGSARIDYLHEGVVAEISTPLEASGGQG